jgi:toxin FitB
VYLLDTNVVSELRRKRPHGAVVAWLQTVPDADLHISAATIGELQVGIEMTREQNPARADEIETWLEAVAATYNVLPMDASIFRTWARLMHRQTGSFIEDAMIAATAVVHDLTVATRNSRDFQKLGVRIFNPFTMSPV